MREVTFVLDGETGATLLKASRRLPREFLVDLVALLGPSKRLGCARPLHVLPPPAVPEHALSGKQCLRISGYYHNSLLEGPGRRSSALLTGCHRACKGCAVPHLHAVEAGSLVPVDRLADVLLDPCYRRDGVSILGGEPFLQPDGLLALVRALRARGCGHILVYSGHIYEALVAWPRRQSTISAILESIDVLIDGAYVEALASSAGPWTGSGNQRVIDLVATRRAGQVICLTSFRHTMRAGEPGQKQRSHGGEGKEGMVYGR